MKTDSAVWPQCATWVFRIITGGVFIVSGFVKAIDPWGTLYKFDDYLAAMSVTVWPNLEIVGVFGLCALEFVIGIFLLLGCFRRSAAIMAAVMMSFLLPLTLWIAVANPVEDCGCFGDAFAISNWATFWKNVFLSIGIIWLLIYNKGCRCLVTPALQWIAFVATGIFVVVIELFGYLSQPLIEFRPYHEGEYLTDVESLSEEEPKMTFVYEKNGESKEFEEDDELPDEESGWKFVERRESPIVENGYPHFSSGHTLRIWSKDGADDETEEAIPILGKELVVMIPDLGDVSPATTWKLNSMYEWSEKNEVKMIAVVSGSIDEIDIWEDLSMASYPIYTADDTQIKEVVRGNPGVVYLVDGKIIWKSTLGAINIDDFLSPDTTNDASGFIIDNDSVLYNCIGLYVIVMAVLILMSFVPNIGRMFFKKNKTVQS